MEAEVGGDLYELKEILGHHSVTVTEQHYLHLRPEHFATDLALLNPAMHGRPGPRKVHRRRGPRLARKWPVEERAIPLLTEEKNAGVVL